MFSFSRILGVSSTISSTTHSIHVRFPTEIVLAASSSAILSFLNGTPCSSIPAILTDCFKHTWLIEISNIHVSAQESNMTT